MIADSISQSQLPDKPHDQAKSKIETWRGHCLDLFARGERCIGQAFEAIFKGKSAPPNLKLRHLAGQRLDDLAKYFEANPPNGKLAKSIAQTLDAWQVHNESRTFLAHGCLTVTLDQRGKWFAVFDMTVYRSGLPICQRLALGEAEAGDFATELEVNWKLLSSQLGHVRKSLEADQPL